MDINTYLKGKLKEKNLTLEDLITRSGASKSTIYRVITGAQKPSKTLEKKIISILNLNYKEQQELLYHFSISDVDDNIIKSREAVYNLLFNKETNSPQKIELVYYDEEKYVRTFDNILDKVIDASKRSNFTCQFKVINCIQNDVIHPLAKAATSLLANTNQYTIEHLINFSTHDYKENIKTLANILPLLTLENYSLKYREEENVSKQGFFHDFMAINYSYHKSDGSREVVNLYITILPNNLSACYVVKENQENTLDFFERNYNALQEQYQPALNSRSCFLEYMNTAKELHGNYDSTLFKAQIPLIRIPAKIHCSVVERTPMEEFFTFYFPEQPQEISLKNHIDELLKEAKLVEKTTYSNKQLDIYTKAGLAQFASTGRLIDHLKFMPPYNKSEIKSILKSLKTRDKNPKDPFNFLILEESYASENLTFLTGDNHCLIIEKYDAGITPFCIFQHERLSAIFTDFAYNYIPAMMSIPQKEAHDYIDDLIDEYC